MSADPYVDMVIRDYREIQSKLGTSQETTATLVQSVVAARISDVMTKLSSHNNSELIRAIFNVADDLPKRMPL